MKIRRAGEQDISEILELMLKQQEEDAAYDPFLDFSPRVREGFEKYLRSLISSEKGFLLVAEENGKVIAYLSARLGKYPGYAKPLRVCFVHNLYVLPEYRHRGIGTKLFEKLCEICDADVFDLEVYAGNREALSFWLHRGFREFTVRLVKTKLRGRNSPAEANGAQE